MGVRGVGGINQKEIIERVLEALRIKGKAGELGKDLDISGRSGNRILQKSSKQEEADSDPRSGA